MSLLAADCVHEGCRYTQLMREIQTLRLANQEYQERFRDMNTAHMDTRGFALWCTPGNHPFSDADLKRKPISTIDDDGNDVTVMMCSLHLPDYMKPGAKRKVSLKALMAEIGSPDVEVTE